MHKKLFEPIRIGTIELPNRIKFPPLALSYAVDDMVTDRLKNFYAERAKGGVGFIGLSFGLTRLEQGPFPGIYDDKFIPGLKEIVEVVHNYGAKIFAQFGAGYYWSFSDGPVELVGPSGTSLSKRPGTPFRLGGPLDQRHAVERALTIDEIKSIMTTYGEAAHRAKEAGLDAVEFIASTGYMVSRFISPLTNKRTDQYGGSFENRMRFLLEIIESCKKSVGEDYPLMCRISGAQLIEGGYTLEDSKLIASMLEKAGICAIDVIGGGWHEASVASLTSSVPPGAKIFFAEEIKQAVNIPVAANGRITDPILAEQIISQGRADLVSLARALIADPDLPIKAKKGRFDDIRPCICCCRCFETVDTGVICSVNARAGREGQYDIKPSAKPKKIAIIGGGPAGMEAASVAALRGHRVTLCEKGSQLGGQLIIAAIPPYKDEISKFRDYLNHQVEKSGVEVRLGEEITPQAIKSIMADAVIVATGASPLIPSIPGAEGKNVITALEVLTGRKEVGEEVVIIGGGMVGCETAEYLAQRGKKVTILEMLERLASDIPKAVRWELLQRLGKAGVRMETKVNIIEITENGVNGKRNGEVEFFKGNNIVIAAGMKPEGELGKYLTGIGAEVYTIGDQLKPQKIAEAMESGIRVASGI